MELEFTISDILKNVYSVGLPTVFFVLSPLAGSAMLLGALIQRNFFYKDKNGYDPLTIAFSDYPFCNTAKPNSEVQEDFQLGLVSMIVISAALSLVDIFSPLPTTLMFYFGMGISRFGDEIKDGIDSSCDATKFKMSFKFD